MREYEFRYYTDPLLNGARYKVFIEPKKINVGFRLLDRSSKLPKKNKNAIAYDLYLPKDVTIYPWTRGKLIPTGIAVNFPKGVGAKTYARSSINKNTKLRINTGLIDNDYRGEIFLNVDNLSWWRWYRFKAGERIAQLELIDILPTTAEEIYKLDDTERGSKGFGSSGR